MWREKYNSVNSKENPQKNKSSKYSSKFPSKTLILSQWFYCQLWTMFGHFICSKFKNIGYIQRQNRIVKTRKMKVKSIEPIIAMTMIKTIITKIMITIMVSNKIKSVQIKANQICIKGKAIFYWNAKITCCRCLSL